MAEAHPTGNPFNQLAKDQLHDALAHAAQTAATGRLVDIGCGQKPYKTMFAPYVSEHIGVDHPESPHALTHVDVLAGAYDIPLESGSFDTALMLEVLEHLETPPAALREAARLLTPGGHLILTTPMIWPLHEEPRDFYRYTPHSLRFLLADAGFDDIAVTPLSGQWATVALLAGYAIRNSHAAKGRAITARGVRLMHLAATRLDSRKSKPWMSWNHMVIARRGDRVT